MVVAKRRIQRNVRKICSLISSYIWFPTYSIALTMMFLSKVFGWVNIHGFSSFRLPKLASLGYGPAFVS